MGIKCYYVVKARTVFHNSETGEIEFRARIKKFENQNPIEARKAAFDFRNEFIYGLLTLGLQKTEEEIGWNPYTKQIEKLSEKEIRRLLNPFFEKDNTESRYDDNSKQITYWAPTILNKEDNTEEEINWVAPDDTLSYYSKFNNGIWVVFVHNDNDSELESYDDDIVIDKITKYEEPVPTPPHWTNLEIEYKFYKKHNFETDDIETTINFFDDEEYSEGYDIEDNETEEEAEIRNLAESKKTFRCLKTPFDWTGYDKINWWKEEEEEIDPVIKDNNKLPITIEEAFIRGENHLVEFKPGLINWKNSERDIELEVAKTLCAFLNSKGGYLFIGIADKERKVHGITYPDNSQDKFLREFTRIKARYLPTYLVHSINGDFYSISGKTIFVITVFPSFDPVFIKRRDNQNKIINKEFYVRSDASSRHIYDIEEVVRYCRKRDRENEDNV